MNYYISKFSIRKQLIILISLVVFVTLIFASFLVYKISYINYKKQLVNKTESIAQIIGVNNQSAIAFNDPNTAKEILSKLEADPSIKMSSILTAKRKVFATYVKGERPNWMIIRKNYKNDNYEFSEDALDLISDIYFMDEKIATVYMQVSLDTLNEQLKSLIKALALVVLASYIFSLISIYFVSQLITRPILTLAHVTSKITSDKDYHRRIEEINAKTEISILYKGFNNMLDLIELRNDKLSETKDELADQRDYIEDQRDYIVEQRDKIQEQSKILEIWKHDITESINYAKNIQQNMLLSIDRVKELYQDSFILFKPRDIVSGDFYWCHRIEDEFIFCAADCTGHGVPGAMISVIGNILLNQIVIGNNITEPDIILNELDQRIIHFFRKEENENVSDDGMDISICKLNTKTNKLQYAGANNSAYIIRNGELIELIADKQSLGSGSNVIVRDDGFKLHTFDVIENDSVYLFSDGYMDQFGGPKGKKFMRKRFKQLLTEVATHDIDKQLDILDNELKEWMQGLEQVDDIIIVGVKI